MSVARRAVAVAVIATALLTVTFAHGARAGGAVFDLDDDRYYFWGERVVTTTTFGDDIKGRGSVADGPWFAYLGRSFVATHKIVGSSTRLGSLTFNRLGRHFYRARLEFTVPSVTPGPYTIQVCNSPCTDELGEILGGTLNVARTDAEATVLGRIDKAEDKVVALVDRSRRDTRTHVTSSIADLARAVEADVDALRRELRSLERPARREDAPAWPMFVGGLVVGALASWPLVRRRGARMPERDAVADPARTPV